MWIEIVCILLFLFIVTVVIIIKKRKHPCTQIGGSSCAKDPKCFDANYECTSCCTTDVAKDGTSCWDSVYTKTRCCKNQEASLPGSTAATQGPTTASSPGSTTAISTGLTAAAVPVFEKISFQDLIDKIPALAAIPYAGPKPPAKPNAIFEYSISNNKPSQPNPIPSPPSPPPAKFTYDEKDAKKLILTPKGRELKFEHTWKCTDDPRHVDELYAYNGKAHLINAIANERKVYCENVAKQNTCDQNSLFNGKSNSFECRKTCNMCTHVWPDSYYPHTSPENELRIDQENNPFTYLTISPPTFYPGPEPENLNVGFSESMFDHKWVVKPTNDPSKLMFIKSQIEPKISSNVKIYRKTADRTEVKYYSQDGMSNEYGCDPICDSRGVWMKEKRVGYVPTPISNVHFQNEPTLESGGRLVVICGIDRGWTNDFGFGINYLVVLSTYLMKTTLVDWEAFFNKGHRYIVWFGHVRANFDRQTNFGQFMAWELNFEFMKNMYEARCNSLPHDYYPYKTFEEQQAPRRAAAPSQHWFTGNTMPELCPVDGDPQWDLKEWDKKCLLNYKWESHSGEMGSTNNRVLYQLLTKMYDKIYDKKLPFDYAKNDFLIWKWVGHGTWDRGITTFLDRVTTHKMFTYLRMKRNHRKIDILDCNSNCWEGRSYGLAAYSPHARHMLAATYPRGGVSVALCSWQDDGHGDPDTTHEEHYGFGYILFNSYGPNLAMSICKYNLKSFAKAYCELCLGVFRAYELFIEPIKLDKYCNHGKGCPELNKCIGELMNSSEWDPHDSRMPWGVNMPRGKIPIREDLTYYNMNQIDRIFSDLEKSDPENYHYLYSTNWESDYCLENDLIPNKKCVIDPWRSLQITPEIRQYATYCTFEVNTSDLSDEKAFWIDYPIGHCVGGKKTACGRKS